MKTGDTVTVQDGSYSMSLIKGKMQHASGNSLINRRFRVLAATGEYPTDQIIVGGKQVNDTLLVDINDKDFMLFTQERFCRVVNSAPEVSHGVNVDFIVPRGVKRISLILQ